MRLLYRQDQYPVFQNRAYDSPAEARACVRGDIRLVEDLRTGLVFNEAFDPALMKYDDHYQNEQAKSPVFQSHLEEVARIVARHLGREALVEVGCGKGYFLELLLAKGLDVAGFDPAYEGRNPRIQKHYFGEGASFQAQGMVLRHVLEHVCDPVGFLRRLRDANGGRGQIYVEVPCLDWICRHRAWFDVYYEHVNYFRLSDFRRMFGTVAAAGRLFGGQYLYVVADLASLRIPVRDPGDAASFPEDFLRGIAGPPPRPGPAAIWGAASKGVVFALARERMGRPIDVAIDVNPAKQGKYLPATGLRVQSPAEAMAVLPAGSTVYIMNSNYLEEIRQMSNNQYHYEGIDHE